MAKKSYDPAMLNELLPIYYRRLFPYDSYCQWVGAGGSKNKDKTFLARREFSFTLEDDIYIRYLSFTSADELQAEMVKRLPHKIDLGAVFNARPSDHKKISNFQPQEKELVFDIDMTDYDDVRTCCEGAAICPNCWQFMIIAVKILNRALKEDFGFQHMLWVYSGRRGIHCWVSDPAARKLGQSGRSAVAEYLQILTGGDSKTKKVNLKGNAVHPSIKKALEIVKKQFNQVCLEGQDILGTPERWQKVLALIPDEKIRKQCEDSFPTKKNSAERWSVLTSCVKENTVKEIMLQFIYPRLDINVSKGLNHLLKSPFCVHPKTGRVCVPFNPDKVEDFNPETVPTISQLAEELDKFASSNTEDSKKKTKDHDKTSLKEPMAVFRRFLLGLSKTWNVVDENTEPYLVNGGETLNDS